MIRPEQISCEVILSDKYYLADLVESLSLEESLDEVAVRATISLRIPDGLSDVPDIRTGQKLDITGRLFGSSIDGYLMHRGIVWGKQKDDRSGRQITLTAYDPAIYLARNEDEILWPKGLTASQRLRRLAQEWSIPTGAIADTGVPLAKSIYRSRPIWAMIVDDLKETVKKGGRLYRPRMTSAGLELVRLGGNAAVWALEADRNLEEAASSESLDDAVTQVKVLGAQQEGKRSRVLEIVKNDANKARLGTIQKVVQEKKAGAAAEAKAAARAMLCGPLQTHSLTGPDINTLRAGDAVYYGGEDLIVISVKHDLMIPGRMRLEAGSPEVVRRRYYAPE